MKNFYSNDNCPIRDVLSRLGQVVNACFGNVEGEWNHAILRYS